MNRKTYEKESVTIRPYMGEDIWSVIKDALLLSLEQDCPVQFDFNGRSVRVDPKPFIAELHRGWAGDEK